MSARLVSPDSVVAKAWHSGRVSTEHSQRSDDSWKRQCVCGEIGEEHGKKFKPYQMFGSTWQQAWASLDLLSIIEQWMHLIFKCLRYTHTHLLDAALDGKRTDQSDQDSRVAMSHRHLRQKSIKGLTLTQISIHMYYIVLSCIHKRPQKSKNCTCLFSARPKSEAIQNIQIAPKTDATKLQNDNVDGHTLTIAIIAQESSQPVLVPHWHERSPHASGRSRCAQVAPDAKIKAGSAAGPVEAPKIKTFTNA